MVKNKQQSKPFQLLNSFWIIGAGRFGQIAVERIAVKNPDALITVIEEQPIEIASKGVTTIRQDGTQWLADNLTPASPVDVIVPAIPVHVAVEWIKYNLQNKYNINPIIIQDEWLDRMPHPMRGGAGQVYVSHADFLCPDNCPEPETICTHTGKPRPTDLFRLLAAVDFANGWPVVLRSHQILPGVGGIYPQDLFDALETVIHHRSQPLMIATACRCHGVIDFIQLKPKPFQLHE